MSHTYGSLIALDDITVTIGAGEFVFVVGPSGAGKSTFLKLIHGEFKPKVGGLWIGDAALHELPRRRFGRIRRRIGFVFQDYKLLPNLTALENVAFAIQVADVWLPGSEVTRRSTRLLTQVGLGDRLNAFPAQLSGGQQQRLAIARALASRPTILLADEPTGNLDEENAQQIVELLERLAWAGATVVFATHDLQKVRTRQHRVIRLMEGTLRDDVLSPSLLCSAE